MKFWALKIKWNPVKTSERQRWTFSRSLDNKIDIIASDDQRSTYDSRKKYYFSLCQRSLSNTVISNAKLFYNGKTSLEKIVEK
jgi:hypothetical protein